MILKFRKLLALFTLEKLVDGLRHILVQMVTERLQTCHFCKSGVS